MKNLMFIVCLTTLLTSASARSQAEVKMDSMTTHQKHTMKGKHRGKRGHSGDRKHKHDLHIDKHESKQSRKMGHK